MVQVFNKDLKITLSFPGPENQSKKDTWGTLLKITNWYRFLPIITITWIIRSRQGTLMLLLPDYIKFIQLNINGLKGQNNYLKKQYLHFYA